MLTEPANPEAQDEQALPQLPQHAPIAPHDGQSGVLTAPQDVPNNQATTRPTTPRHEYPPTLISETHDEHSVPTLPEHLAQPSKQVEQQLVTPLAVPSAQEKQPLPSAPTHPQVDLPQSTHPFKQAEQEALIPLSIPCKQTLHVSTQAIPPDSQDPQQHEVIALPQPSHPENISSPQFIFTSNNGAFPVNEFADTDEV